LFRKSGTQGKRDMLEYPSQFLVYGKKPNFDICRRFLQQLTLAKVRRG